LVIASAGDGASSVALTAKPKILLMLHTPDSTLQKI